MVCDSTATSMSRVCGVVANYLASQARDPGIDSHQHQKDSWHIWRHLRSDTVFSCNLRCLLIFLHGRSRTYRVASLCAGPVGRISYNLYFDCKHVRYVTCDFNKRIYSQIITKAYQRIAVIFRGFYTRNVTFLIRAYKTYIRPILEYCTQIWNPYLIGEITAIEKVQKYFTKRLSGMKSLNYNDRLQRLNLESLELRRLKADLVMYFKIVHGAVDLNADDFFKRSPIDNTRSNGYKLSKPYFKTFAAQNHFNSRCIRIWNALPVEIMACKSTTAFKRKLNGTDLNKYNLCF